MYQEIILGLATLFVLAYFYFHSQWKYWTKIGVFQTKPTFPFGTLSAFFTKQEAFIDFAKRQGDEAGNRPFYGGYFLLSPVLFLKDVDLVKQVTVKDFDHFVDRNSSTMKKIFFGGKTLNSEEMLEWGLVHEVVSDEELKQRTMEMAKEIAAGPKTALAETKKLLLESERLSLDEELKKEREKNRDSGNTGDAVEGIKAFLEKREPKFE